MFDIAWSELLLIVVLMLVVMGPKDLPKMMNSIGRMMAKARGFAREFTGTFQQMAKESELEDIIKKANRAQSIKPTDIVKSALDPEGNIDEAFSRNTILKDSSIKETSKAAPKSTKNTKSKGAKELPKALPKSKGGKT